MVVQALSNKNDQRCTLFNNEKVVYKTTIPHNMQIIIAILLTEGVISDRNNTGR